MAISPKHLQDLYKLLSFQKTPADMKLLLDDLLTPQEKSKLAERWQIVKLLASGMTQRKIAQTLHVSISKVTRGSRQLQYGSGGFKKYLKRMKK
jgi:TrpR family transcriptional regulator, trp operon repressor